MKDYKNSNFGLMEKERVNQKIKEIAEKAIPILLAHQVVKSALFGSVVHGEDTQESDIDFLIDFGETRKSLFDLVDLQDELEENLHKKVDIITYRSLNKYIKDIILKEQIPIL